MNTKEKILKIVLPCIFVAIFAISLILIFCLPEKQNSKLTISSHDIVLKVNEEKLLTYEVSNPYAVVSFKIQDKDILSASGFQIKGLKTGETIIKFLAKYKDETAEFVCNIKVTNQDTPVDEDDSNTNPNDKVDPPEPVPGEEKTFEIINQDGCEISGNTIYINKDKNCYFRISFTELNNTTDYTLQSSDEISVTKVLSFNSWKIKAVKSGSIQIISNNKIIGTIIIEVI